MAGLVWAASANAQIFFSDVVSIELRPQKLSGEFSWSGQMELTTLGLETRQPWTDDTSREFWFQTQPLATGPSWRPPSAVGVELTLNDLYVLEKTQRAYLKAFGRYSADRVHWSSWFPIASTSRETLAGGTFQSRHELPRFAQAKYQELMRTWWQTDPAWSSDEHEFSLWLAASHRDFFASEIPHMGYVQLLVEGEAQGLRLGGLTIRLNAGMSGLQSRPRGQRRPSADEKWFFDLSRIGN
jgi:hypothetical protein